MKIQQEMCSTFSIFNPYMQHPQFYTLTIWSLILHFCHFLPCLIIPWNPSFNIFNSLKQNVISSPIKVFTNSSLHFSSWKWKGWKWRVESINMKLIIGQKLMIDRMKIEMSPMRPIFPLEIFSIQCMNTEYRYQPLQTIYVLLLFKGW